MNAEHLQQQTAALYKALNGLVEYIQWIAREDGWFDCLPESRDYGQAQIELASARGEALYQIDVFNSPAERIETETFDDEREPDVR